MKHVASWTFIGITKDEYRKLIRVRDRLASGEYQHCADPLNPDNYSGFNMRAWSVKTSCGTAACIGGWMYGNSLMDDEANKAFNPLFYPPSDLEWGDITPAQAVKAIDSFLLCGDPKWHEAAA